MLRVRNGGPLKGGGVRHSRQLVAGLSSGHMRGMSAVRWINRSKIILLVLFVLGTAAAWGYQYLYAWPKARCEGNGRWWYATERACGTPIDITTFTGRPRGSAEDKAALSSAVAKVPGGKVLLEEKAKTAEAAPAPKAP